MAPCPATSHGTPWAPFTADWASQRPTTPLGCRVASVDVTFVAGRGFLRWGLWGPWQLVGKMLVKEPTLSCDSRSWYPKISLISEVWFKNLELEPPCIPQIFEKKNQSIPLTLPETNSSPLKTGLLPQKETIVFQPSIFRCDVSFEGCTSKCAFPASKSAEQPTAHCPHGAPTLQDVPAVHEVRSPNA